MSRISRVKYDRDKLLKCLHRTFTLNEQLVNEEKLKRSCLERERQSLEKEMEAIRLSTFYKKKLDECDSPCIERTWANELKDVIKFMEQKQKQKQVYKDDWLDATRKIKDIVSRLQEIAPKQNAKSKRKTQRRR